MRLVLVAYLGLLGLLGGLAFAGAVVLFDTSGPGDIVEAAVDGHTYNVVSWEIEHFPHKWAYKLRHLWQHRNQSDEESTLRRYFALSDEISRLPEDQQSQSRRDELEDERGGLKRAVEDILEGRITGILKTEGLVLDPPPFTHLGMVFPPVDLDLDAPPRVLAVSPRDHIALDRSFLLDPRLGLGDYVNIEQRAESGNRADGEGVSALVVGTGGLATYPSVVSAADSYDGLIDTAFHEWLHQYLIFFPLGSGYFSSSETRTLNESVANIGGHELAKLYFGRYQRLTDNSASTQPSPTPPGGFDFTQEMRSLRREVEGLLSEGKVPQAEVLMAQKRDEFEAHGYYIRRLNQAYFAFHGFYADTPGSIDPIGPKLQTLLERSGSPGAFVRLARRITSRQQLDEVLSRQG